MHIPDKYRDRYDNLARSHPWMREMRDEPTETIEPVEKLRDWSKWLNCVYATDDGKAYCVYNYKPYDGMKSCGEYMRDLADAIDDMIDRDYVLRRIFDAVCANRDELKAKLGEPTNVTSGETNVNPDGSPLVEGDAAAILRKAAKGFAGGDGRAMGNVAQLIGMDCHAVSDSEILRALAGMVERDYVSRQDFAAQHRTLCAVREQRDRESEANRSYARVIAKLEAERDELTNAVNELQNKQPYCYAPEKPLDTLNTIGRYIDELQAERDEWKRKAEAKSAKRAAAVGRLRQLDEYDDSEDIVKAMVPEGVTVNSANWSVELDAIIDLLTDDDANDDSTPDSDVSAIDADANDVIAKQARAIADLGAQVDSLTVRAVAAETEADELKAIVDRLKAENAELRDECCDCAVKRANRVLSQSVDRLTAERDALAADLADAMAPHAVDMRVKLDEGARLPERAHPTDAGADLFAPHDVVIPAFDSVTVDTGVHVELPGGTVGMLKSKSGLNVKCNVIGEGVIDEGYSGSIVVKLYNLGDFDVKLPAGSKISQLVVLPVLYPRIVEVDEIASGTRGDAGFGSTDAPLTLVDGDGEVVG